MTETKAERLARLETKARAKLAATRRELARVESQQRREAREARARRLVRVGALADEAGLLAWEDRTLVGLFALLAMLRDTPNPVAVLESLLTEVCAPDPRTAAVADSCRLASLRSDSLAVSRVGQGDFSPSSCGNSQNAPNGYAARITTPTPGKT